ncbi:hypothetical protein ACP4OV_006917 [Aristida adscensionis]
MGNGRTTMEVGADGVAVITIINPPANALSFDVLYSLHANYQKALRRNDVKAIVLTGEGGVFCGGLDIGLIAAIQKNAEQIKINYLDALTDILEASGKPLVAAINGPALGGGLEFSMACEARISIPTAQLCLPELKLGVITGFGVISTTSTPCRILLSKTVTAEEAHQLGLVDAIASPEDLLSTARRWALDICESRRQWIRALRKTDKLESPEEAREIFKFARAQAQKQAPNLKHPLIFIDVIEEGIVSGPRAGLRKRATLKIPGVTDLGLMPRDVAKVAVVGGGLMGSGIATALILSRYPVILKEVNEKFLNAGIGRIKSLVREGKMTEEKYEKTLSLLTGVLDYGRFKEVDLVIEAAPEDMELKQQFFAELEQHCTPHCTLATNTSTIDLNLITAKTNCHDHIIGAHFFSPAHTMPLLEIVRFGRTSAQAIVDLLDVGKKIKKTPIVVGNGPGFAVNRMFFPYTQAALLLVDHGMDLYKIDRACTEFGMPVGPFRLADMVGFEVALATGLQYLENFPDRVYKSMLVPLMIEDRRTGEASQKGFYKYEGKRKATPDPEILKYVEKSRSIAGATPDPELMKIEDKDLVEMVFFPVINEACRVLDEGIAVKASDLDIASIFGMGFPPYRGGIMYWAGSIGATRIHTKLSEWEVKYGQFFRPCSYLSERAASGLPLRRANEPGQISALSYIIWKRRAVTQPQRSGSAG